MIVPGFNFSIRAEEATIKTIDEMKYQVIVKG